MQNEKKSYDLVGGTRTGGDHHNWTDLCNLHYIMWGGGILGSKNFTVTQTEMQELMASGDPKYSFTLIDSSGNEKPLNFVDGIAVAPSEEGEYTLYASYTEYGTTYYSNGIPFIVKKPDPYWFYFGDSKTLVLKSGPDVPAGYGATVTGSGKIPSSISFNPTGSGWEAYRSEMVKAVVADEITAPEDMSNWFREAENLASLEGFENLDTSNVKYMSNMFFYCKSLNDISSLAEWDTGSVESMVSMFYGCTALEKISALTNWETSNVKYMGYMFSDCTALNDISALTYWDTGSVESMATMFYECTALEDISALADWNTSNVTNMGHIFSGCNSVTNWTSLNEWDVSKVTLHYFAFSDCKEPLPSWVAEW